jgi:hypothetical protein
MHVDAWQWHQVLGHIPNVPHFPPAADDTDVDVAQWICALNRWKDSQLDEWKRCPTWQHPKSSSMVHSTLPLPPGNAGGIGGSRRGGEWLLDYALMTDRCIPV